MNSRPDYITCIRRDPCRAWCGRNVSMLFHFATIEHAARAQLNGDRLLVCPECRDAVVKALNSQEATQ